MPRITPAGETSHTTFGCTAATAATLQPLQRCNRLRRCNRRSATQRAASFTCLLRVASFVFLYLLFTARCARVDAAWQVLTKSVTVAIALPIQVAPPPPTRHRPRQSRG